nr:thioredoxin domain-containing protein [uncultured Carboxylicivirga sp.]
MKNNRIINDHDLVKIKQTDENDIIFGSYNAPQSIILYFDYNCSYCQKFFKEVYPELKDSLIDNKQVKLIFRLVCKPNDAKALKAYRTAICINKFGQFEKLHKLLLYKPGIIYTKYFDGLIDEYISTNENVAECILNRNETPEIKNIYQFQTLKTKGTPTFIIGNEIKKGYLDFEAILKLLNQDKNNK